jgi:GT2 family glycosyltransferase/glycosyltransferase involved in cell wall biosynthesis
MNQLAPNAAAHALEEQRRRFLRGVCRGAAIAEHAVPGSPHPVLAQLDARVAARILADLGELAGNIAQGGLLAVAELPSADGGDPALRAELGRRFRHVTSLQQRALHGSVFAGERHAASRILPLAEPLQSRAICLLHLASNAELPPLASSFLEDPGLAPLYHTGIVSLPATMAPALDRPQGVALIERLVAREDIYFEQVNEIAKLQSRARDVPARSETAFFDNPRELHPWPLADDRTAPRDHYDHRVDDAAILEGDRGAAFIAQFNLLGPRPNFDGAVAELNASAKTLLSATPDVSIIIPVYGQLGYTLNCLHSLFALAGRATAEIIIVDDCSPDISGIVLAGVKGIALIRMFSNGGFITSCNIGASQARGRYVVFLNNDTRVVDGWLDAMLDSFSLFPKAGLVGSKLLYPDGSLQEAGGIIWRDGSCWNFGRNDDPNRPHYSFAREADYISGASVMVPARLLQSLGGFDRHYAPAYCEDADLALKIRKAGYEVWFQPQSRVVHYEGRTSGTDTGHGVKAYQVVNSRKLYVRWRNALAGHRPNGQAPFLERERGVQRRVLVVDATVPTPRQDAGSVTTTLTLQLFRALGYKVSFVPQDNFLFQPGHSTDLMRAGIEVAYAPYEIGFEEYLRRYGWSFDVVLVYRVTVLEQVIEPLRRLAPQAPVLFHTMDLHFLRMQREAQLSGNDIAMAEANAMRERELGMIRAADCTITHSTYEQELLGSAAPDAPVVVWPFMFAFHGTDVGFAARRDFVFLGGYRHSPNVDAVLFFVHEILPLIHRHEPSARFIIAGANPTPEVLALAGSHVIVTGEIDDLRTVFDTARVFACSLRIGAGTKGKVSTAMAYGLPVVSTSCGAEGMALIDGENVLLADGAENFAEACLRAYREPALWQTLSERGQALVREKHSLAMGERVLEAAIETALEHRLGLDQPAAPAIERVLRTGT